MSRILSVLKKEFIQMRRDRLTFALVFMMPLIQLLLFGYAIQTEVKHIPTIVFDQSLTNESRELLASFSASGYFDVIKTAKNYAEVNQAIAVANSIGLLKSQEILAQKVQFQGPPYDIRVRPWYNPDGITAYFMVPAILGIIVTMTMVIITAVAIVRERERGTLEQLLVTPIKPYELMIGKILPYIALGYIQITVALVVAVTVFDVPIKGSLLELYLLTLFFITASLGLGIFISNIAKTQMQAFQMSFFVMLPSILLSGFMFPRDAMPQFIYYLSAFIPLTYYLDIIRGIILKGIGFQYLVGQVTALLVFSIVLLIVSTLKFKKKIV
ncbi:MAG: ABC transporter permease [Syntrophomonadaceae bacterium]|nr:ABC transporter permease [Syntrophomonadaceae bacterium]